MPKVVTIIVCFAFLEILKGPYKNTQTSVEPTGAGIIIVPPAVLGPDLLSAEESLFLRPAKEHHNAPKGCRSATATQALPRPARRASGSRIVFLASAGHPPRARGLREASDRVERTATFDLLAFILPADNAGSTRAPADQPATRQPPSCVGPTFVGHVTSGLRSDRRPRASTA